MTRWVPHTIRHGSISHDDRECSPSFTIEQHISSLRDEDPKRWEELQSEWREPNGPR